MHVPASVRRICVPPSSGIPDRGSRLDPVVCGVGLADGCHGGRAHHERLGGGGGIRGGVRRRAAAVALLDGIVADVGHDDCAVPVGHSCRHSLPRCWRAHNRRADGSHGIRFLDPTCDVRAPALGRIAKLCVCVCVCVCVCDCCAARAHAKLPSTPRPTPRPLVVVGRAAGQAAALAAREPSRAVRSGSHY